MMAHLRLAAGTLNHGAMHQDPCDANYDRRQVSFGSKSFGPGTRMAKHVTCHGAVSPVNHKRGL